MREVSHWQKLVIYFSTAPYLIGEGFLLGALAIPIIAYPNPKGLFALFFLAVGAFFVTRKVRMVNYGCYILRHGIKSEAEIIRITNTNIEHNNRTVKVYTFRFQANGRRHHYEYQSAYRRYLKTGDKMTIFFLEDNPAISFIPILYNLRIK